MKGQLWYPVKSFRCGFCCQAKCPWLNSCGLALHLKNKKERKKKILTERNNSRADFLQQSWFSTAVTSEKAAGTVYWALWPELPAPRSPCHRWFIRRKMIMAENCMGILLLMGPRKGTDWYITNNENIILIVIQHKLQTKQTANFRYIGHWNKKFYDCKDTRSLPLIPTAPQPCFLSLLN